MTPRTRGIIAVHLYGHPADMDELEAVASGHDLWIIEDAAEAHLAIYKGRPVGSLGRIATFSFYGNKPLTSGEGGALTTDSPELAEQLRLLRGQGMDPERRYYFPVTGYNYRLTNVACALLCAQLERSEFLIARRREIFAMYRELLDGIPGIQFQPRPTGRSRRRGSLAFSWTSADMEGAVTISLRRLRRTGSRPGRSSSLSTRFRRSEHRQRAAATGFRRLRRWRRKDSTCRHTRNSVRADVVAVAEAIRRLMS